MSAIGTRIRLGLMKFFMPEMSSRRALRGGLTRENLLIWALFTGVIGVTAVFLAGKTVTLYLPHYYSWQWVDVTVLELPVWGWAIAWLTVSSLCFYPRASTVAISLAFSLYYIYAAANGAPISIPGIGRVFNIPYLPIYAFHYFLPLFIAFSGLLVFILYPARKSSPQDRPSFVDLLLCMAILVSTFDFIWNFAERGERAGLIHWNDVVFGVLMTIVSIEMCRRVLGMVLPALGLVFLAYTLFGQYFPDALAHRGFPFNEVISYLYSTAGIYGTIASVFATYVFLFIVFGAILQMTKVGDVFIDIAFALVGRFNGGAAKASIISSGLVGSIVGSGAANIAVTGTFTIPLMKRSGYKPHYAAGVEATASIGGHLMPPIMGSAAFLVAAFAEVNYGTVALVSLVPALMYYYSVYMAVHYKACRDGISGLPRDKLPKFGEILRQDGYRLLPVGLLILLLVFRFSPFYAAFWSILAALAVSCTREDTRLLQLPTPLAKLIGHGGSPAPQEGEENSGGFLAEWGGLIAGVIVFAALPPLLNLSLGASAVFAIVAIILFSSPRLINALTHGATGSLVIAATAGIMGIVLAGVTMPGLALRFPAIVLEYAGGSLPIAIVLCAIASYIMGMGMTITAAYVILAILAVPALVELGVPLLNAHLIILWLSQDSSLTPPFALGAFIAAGVAGADPTRTGFVSVMLAKPLYIVPFLMAYSPILMDPGTPWWDILIVWATGFVGFFCLAVGMEGFFRRPLSWWERIVFFGAAGAFFFQVWWIKLVAFGLLALGVAVQTLVKSPTIPTSARTEPQPEPGGP